MPVLFDDIFRFGEDGSFSNVMGDQTWLEPWQGADLKPVVRLLRPMMVPMLLPMYMTKRPPTITVNGLGAHLGLAKVFNGGELASSADAKESITYTITAQTDTTMTLDIEIAGGGYWRFKLVRRMFLRARSALPVIGSVAPEAGALGVGPASKGDTSWLARSGEADSDWSVPVCLMISIRFGADGSFSNVMGDESWLEAMAGCSH